MDRNQSRKIAETITNEQILEMFNNAKERITDWTVVSNVNNGITKGTAWNILAKDFDKNRIYQNIPKVNMVREFGEYLPEELKTKKLDKKIVIQPLVHQDPEF